MNKTNLSILGDSISTYKGISDNPDINASIICNQSFYKPPFSQEDTYWEILIKRLSLKLCVNNSYSGGNLSGKDDPCSGINRAYNLSRNDGTSPDIIILFMGINDLGRGVPPELFEKDYALTLRILKEKYPEAYVCCVHIPDRDPVLKKRAQIFNSSIEKAVRDMGSGYFIADLFSSRLNNDFYYINTRDGLHPDEDGMRIIADVIEDTIRRVVS